MLQIYKPVEAYAQPELFDAVKLKIDFEPEAFSSYTLPVCIEAVPECDSQIVFIVKAREGGGHTFAPRKKDAIQFAEVKQAQEYIDNTLKPRYGNKWTFKIWSMQALAK